MKTIGSFLVCAVALFAAVFVAVFAYDVAHGVAALLF